MRIVQASDSREREREMYSTGGLVSNLRTRHGAFLATLSVVALSSVAVSLVIYQVEPEPYMDEIWHVPMAFNYCAGNYSHWDEGVTTLPGVYALSMMLLFVLGFFSSANLCTVYALRCTNMILGLGNWVAAYAIAAVLARPGDPMRLKPLLVSAAVNSLPILQSLTHVYYTDPGGVFFLLLMYLSYLHRRHWLAVTFGAVAVFFRQSSVVWVAMTAGFAVLNTFEASFQASYENVVLEMLPQGDKNGVPRLHIPGRCENGVHEQFSRDCENSVQGRCPGGDCKNCEVCRNIFQGNIPRDCRKGLHECREEHYENGVQGQRQGSNKDGVRRTTASRQELQPKHRLHVVWTIVVDDLRGALMDCLGYCLVGICFAAFIVFNDGVVVGDQRAHRVCFHPPQMGYYLVFTLFHAAPHLLRPSVIADFRKSLARRPLLYAVITLISVLAVQNCTHLHPYTLLDNRHLTFHVWTQVMGRGPLVRCCLVPAYVYAGYAVLRRLEHTQLLWRALYLACVFAATSFHEMLEFRYFIVPYVFFRLHVRGETCRELFAELVLNSVTYCAMLYMFLSRAVVWNIDGTAQSFFW
ncbi:LOW QUALITY PROTEIN: putative Dol-P-Glc:Glc(2)Man(9)GlcNAc(2)-PP-Dol alpha-1,2-glucosyltransferase [Dermacentor silvarum]|uniref:LOW QUALITY PROTEIN: putative Dol-P-Glc:Glc(2)Man(9)GlcNAc(2)-PP-Dol alpha-1,2-glucosyltransferase n=1 Tax=Dermacentor silvarum TaxID=543639 RepID=UPI002100E412|nr:LOW QUALITY PROTEIN: putative Dol-P-Glc:Glc(2)Man(9)GlcNAc(2)-PP-Dol alpha-1,2-glucosyltransferase [Dermacentor silvarum]